MKGNRDDKGEGGGRLSESGLSMPTSLEGLKLMFDFSTTKLTPLLRGQFLRWRRRMRSTQASITSPQASMADGRRLFVTGESSDGASRPQLIKK